jgi:DNA-binding MarR family transcriptional regulator
MPRLPPQPRVAELVADIRSGVVEEVQRRVRAAGFRDARATHDCVFRYLDPEGSRLAELAERSGMTAQSIGWHVDELERHGYLERVSDSSDRRAKIIRPTDKGVAFMRAGGEALAEIEREWANTIGPEQLAQVREALGTIRASQAPPA